MAARNAQLRPAVATHSDAPRRPRVGVVGSTSLGSPYPAIDDCDVEVMAIVPDLEDVPGGGLISNYDVLLVGASAEDLTATPFRERAVRVTSRARCLLVVPGAGVDAATVVRLGFRGVVAREVPPEALTRAIGAVARGELAFPRSMTPEMLRIQRIGANGARSEGKG